MRADASGLRDTGSSPDAAEATDADAPDAGVGDDAAEPIDASLGSRCTVTPTSATCAHETTMLPAGTGLPMRDVHYQVPLGAPPAAGFPVVIAFQGAALSAELTWTGQTTDVYGRYFQTLVVARLLDAGYAVITPEAAGDGSTYYDTNIPPYATFWETSPDHQLMLGIFAGIDAGDFGPLDPSSLFATGFSSGGYMTSRMAVSYAGRFRSLAIQSGSYATCAGAVCVIPTMLPADHPPTLFLHSEVDVVVPISTMRPYEAQLRTQGITTRIVTDPTALHGWIAAAPDEVLAWFDASR